MSKARSPEGRVWEPHTGPLGPLTSFSSFHSFLSKVWLDVSHWKPAPWSRFSKEKYQQEEVFVWRSSKWEKIWEKLTLYWTKWKRIGSQCYAGCNLSGTKATLWGFLSLRTSSTLLALLTGHEAVFLGLRCMLVPSNFSSKGNLNFSPMKAALRCFVSEVITQRQHVLARMQLQWIGTEISKKHFWSISVICRGRCNWAFISFAD